MSKQQTGDPVGRTVRARPLALIVGLGLMAVALGLVLLRWNPPHPKAEGAPADQFSAGRAMGNLRELLAEGVPHPVGTENNERVQARIVAQLESLGYKVEIQETVACRSRSAAYGICAPVLNIATRLPGQVEGPAVMIMAHYDSVGGGPGAADDSSNVASILEIARILKAEGPLRNPVIFLLTDGEEVGLMGAKGFVDDHPWARDLGAVINLEARGTKGQSLMFETSDNNAWLIDAYASSVPRPSANSLSYEIYKQMPNDTDLTIFKEAGIAGLNFAFIDHSSHYHTALDNLQNLDPASIQHQGESALAVARALAARDLGSPPPGNAAYLDILGFFMVKWPQAWTLPLALISAALLLVCAVIVGRQRMLTVGGLLLGLLAGLLCLVLPILLGMGLVALIANLGSGAQPWYAYPLPTRLALWAGALLCGGLVVAGLGRRSGLWGLGLAAWLLWAILAIVLSLTLPGAAIILLVPALVASILIAAVVLGGQAGSATALEAALMAAAAFAAVICLPFALMFELATAFDMNPAITLMLGLVMVALSPLFALPRDHTLVRKVLILGSAAVVIAAIVAALLVPTYSENSPQRINIFHATDGDTHQAHWVSMPRDDRTPEPLRGHFEDEPIQVFPWYSGLFLTAEAEPTAAEAPGLEVVAAEQSGGSRTVTLRLRSPRGAEQFDLVLPGARLEEISVAGRALPVAPGEVGSEDYTLRCYGRDCFGLEVQVKLTGTDPLAATVVDYSLGLPDAGAYLLAARPATAVSSQEGDLTVVWRRVEF